MSEIDQKISGQLAGKYIPDSMAEYVNEIVNPASDVFGKKLISEFKYMKVVFSLSTHVRNVISNKILNWLKLGIGPWRVDLDIAAIKDIKTNSEMYQRAQRAGLGASTYGAQELRNLLEENVETMVGKYGGKLYGKMKRSIGDFYDKEEQLSKLIAFKELIKKGMKDDEAWKLAETATFNYSQVTPFVRQLRTAIWGVPFITFPLKATPIAIETALKHPKRISVIGKIKNTIENASDIKE